MDPLRWSLLAIGVAVVVGVYLWSRWQHARRDEGGSAGGLARRRTLSDPGQEPVDDAVEGELRTLGKLIEEERPTPPVSGAGAAPNASRSTGERIIALHLVAAPDRPFPGASVRSAFEQAGLEYGPMGIFHRMGGESGQPIFSVAALIEPGWFDRDAMSERAYPGLTFFMQLPQGGDMLAGFDDMVTTARQLADALGGELRDERRSALTAQTVEHLREEVREHRRRAALAARGSGPHRR